MDIDAIIWIMTAYVFVYYAVARHALGILGRQDKEYFDVGDGDGRLAMGMRTSLAIVEMIFDSDLPGDEFGALFRVELYIARAMLILFVPAFFLLAYISL